MPACATFKKSGQAVKGSGTAIGSGVRGSVRAIGGDIKNATVDEQEAR